MSLRFPQRHPRAIPSVTLAPSPPSPLRRQGPRFLPGGTTESNVITVSNVMHEEKAPAVYIMASRYRGTLYVGVTSALWNRVNDHKAERFGGFTAKYGTKSLVWYEHHHNMEEAIRREKQLKVWKRNWKIRIIEEMNPDWLDLHMSIDTIATLVEPKAGPLPSQG